MKTENALLKHNNEDVLQLDMKNDSFESSLVSPCLFYLKSHLYRTMQIILNRPQANTTVLNV